MFGEELRQFDSRMLQKAFEFFCHKLDLRNIPIHLKTVNNIGRGKTEATCLPNFNSDLELESVNIELKDNGSVIGMIDCLAHECMHARQWIHGDITVKFETRKLFGILPYKSLRKLWKGKDITDLSYYEQPYEIEAFLMQKNLTFEFLKLVESQIEVSNMGTLLNRTDLIYKHDRGGTNVKI